MPLVFFPPRSPLDLETSLGIRVHVILWDNVFSVGFQMSWAQHAGSHPVSAAGAQTAMPVSRRFQRKGHMAEID